MDEIKVAELLLGFEKVDDQNINSVYRGHIQPEHDETPLLAYFKIIPPREVFIESVCSLLCSHLGLPTPKPYLLIMSEAVCPINGKHTMPAFATVDAQSPSFRQYLRKDPSNEQAIIAILKKWVELISAATFDEFIGNTDRNIGNLLFDGKSITLIDHGLAIKETHSHDMPNVQNLLFDMVKNEDELAKKRYKKRACEKLVSYGRIPFDMLAAKTLATLYMDDKSITDVISFLRKRIDYMTDHIAYQLGMENKQRVLR
ncbi:MAG: hypothetical protein PHY54_02140 [Methylococcales bacterium]|nr:hypothetical protein [Methylococcales bacterium]